MAKKKKTPRPSAEKNPPQKDILVIGQPVPESVADLATHINDDFLSITDESTIAKAYPVIIFAPTHCVFEPAATGKAYQDFHVKTYGKPDPDIDKSYWKLRDRFLPSPTGKNTRRLENCLNNNSAH